MSQLEIGPPKNTFWGRILYTATAKILKVVINGVYVMNIMKLFSKNGPSIVEILKLEYPEYAFTAIEPNS